MDTFACRDISNAHEWTDKLRELIESTPFRCVVSVHPQHSVGFLHIEYRGRNKKEVEECDLKLYAKIISFFEAEGNRDLTLLPLKFDSFSSSICAGCGSIIGDSVAYCYSCGRSLCTKCGEYGLCSSCEVAWNQKKI